MPTPDEHVKDYYSHCYIHDVDEEITEDTYIICFECRHVWTKESLEKRYEEITAEMGDPRHKDAEEIFFCQECIHDF